MVPLTHNRTRTGKEPTVSDLYSTGGAAKELDCSPSLLRKLEILGVTTPAHRLFGSDRRAYDARQLEQLRQVIAERRARMTQAEQQAA